MPQALWPGANWGSMSHNPSALGVLLRTCPLSGPFCLAQDLLGELPKGRTPWASSESPGSQDNGWSTPGEFEGLLIFPPVNGLELDLA